MELNDDHFNAFGRITYGYACAESGLKILLSAMLNLEITLTLAMTSRYSSSTLREVMRAMANTSEFESADEKSLLLKLVERFDSFATLRNHIAHSRWTSGSNKTSIKPVNLKIRKGSIKPIGYADSELEYSTDELFEFANALFQLNEDIVDFVNQFGYRERIESMVSG